MSEKNLPPQEVVITKDEYLNIVQGSGAVMLDMLEEQDLVNVCYQIQGDVLAFYEREDGHYVVTAPRDTDMDVMHMRALLNKGAQVDAEKKPDWCPSDLFDPDSKYGI